MTAQQKQELGRRAQARQLDDPRGGFAGSAGAPQPLAQCPAAGPWPVAESVLDGPAEQGRLKVICRDEHVGISGQARQLVG